MFSFTLQPRWMGPFIEEPRVDDEVQPQKKRSLPWVAILLLILAIVGFVLQGIIILQSPSILFALAALYIILVRPRTASIFLLVLYTTLFVLQVSLLASRWTFDNFNLIVAIYLFNIGITLVSIVAVVNLPLRDSVLPRDGISQPFTTPTSTLKSPEDDLTLWQWMSVSWMSSLISLGKKRQLNEEDVWFLGHEFQHRHLHDAFRELHGTVVRRLLRANWHDLALLTILAILELVANYSAPILLQQLLKAMGNLKYEIKPAITFALLILVAELISAQSSVFSLWFGRRAYERSRGEMITMLFEKTLNRKIVATIKDENENDENSNEGTDSGNTPNENGSNETQGLLNGHDNKVDEKQTFLSKVLKPFRRSKKPTPMTEDNAPASMGKILNLMRGDVYEVSGVYTMA
jgi:hypothetical protein